MVIIMSVRSLMAILPHLDKAALELNRADHVLRLGILRAQLFQIAREADVEHSTSNGLEGQEDQHQSILSAFLLP
jgi:hypothetical protein